MRTIEQAKKVRRQAVPEVKKAVVDGDVSLKRAAQIADKPKKAQAKALTEKPNVTAGPWKPATPMPRPVLGPSQQAFDELKEKNSILVDEIDRLNDRLAVERMEDVTDDERLLASTTIAELRAENKTLIAELRAVKAVRDNLMGEVREMTSQLQKQRVMLQKQRA